MTTSVEENEGENNRKKVNINYNSGTLDSDILFYVEGIDKESMKFNPIQKDDAEVFKQNHAQIYQQRTSSKMTKCPIRKDDFNKIILNLNSAFNELFKNDGPNPKIPQEKTSEFLGYSLEVIELNLNIEVGAKVLFSLNTKGSAGIKLVFKRK